MKLFKKSIIVGVSVTPEVGLEVAQIDFETKTVLKYGVRNLEYNLNQREIADLDIFKDTLQDLFLELDIPKNAEIVLNLPAATFRVSDYPAALDNTQVEGAIESETTEDPLFKEIEPDIAISPIPSSSIQFNKYVHTALSKTMILEIALIFKDLGYKIHAIDTSVNSLLNSLIYLDRVNTSPNTAWVLMIVENYCCRVISMIGQYYVDAFEERISIGEVLGDAENYSTVISAVEPYLKTIPSKYLCVVSKTNVISAEALANKLTYSAPITYQEANVFSGEAFLETSASVNPELAATMSLDVIGAAINREFEEYTEVRLNLFNSSLGDVYWLEQPPQFTLFGKTIILTNEKLVVYFAVIAAAMLLLTLIVMLPLMAAINSKTDDLEQINLKIDQANKFLKDNESISSELFDEGDEMKIGLLQNKNVYSYYTIVGTEIPQKVWLTKLKLGNKVTIEGQADNLESIYSFFRNIKDYNPDSNIKLQKLRLASSNGGISGGNYDSESILTSLNADFYEFKISNDEESEDESSIGKITNSSGKNQDVSKKKSSSNSKSKTKKSSDNNDSEKKPASLPSDLEPIKE